MIDSTGDIPFTEMEFIDQFMLFDIIDDDIVCHESIHTLFESVSGFAAAKIDEVAGLVVAEC